MKENQFFKKIYAFCKKISIYIIGFFVLLLFSLSIYISHQSTLSEINFEKIITIPEGMTLIGTANLFEEKGLIRSSLIFRIIGQLKNISVKAGTYSFKNEHKVSEIIERLDAADYGDVYTTITLPEGITIKEMADIFEKKSLKNFNKDMFMTLTKEKEGYLFPDTYLFLPEAETEAIVKTLISTFNKKTEKFRIEENENPWEDIIIMASLIEKEAGNNLEEKKMVAGILWKRIGKGIPLQVDAPFVYAIEKGSSELKTSDLRADGPYNTYTRKGLTPTPIGNPGISSIEAVMNPISSLYFFYLHDTNGGIHYGVTHNDHVRNKQRYL